jgi:tetratricopeptide (TPR) repeat protein
MVVPFVPFLLADFGRGLMRRPGPARAAALTLVAVVLASSLYLYLPLRTPTAHPAFRWAEPVTWGRFQWLVLRRQYVSIEKQGRGRGGLLLAERFGERFRAGYGWVGIVLVPLAIALAVRRRAWWLAAVAAGGACEIAAAAFYPKLEPDALWVADPFFSAGWWAAGLLLAGGVVLVAGLPGRWWRAAALAIAGALAAQAAATGFGQVSKRWSYYASDEMANLAADLPKDAIMFAEGDAYIAPLLYGLFVDGQRPDVRMIIPIFLHFDWGLAQMKMQYPDLNLKALKPWGHIWIEAKDIMEAHPERPWTYSLTTSNGWPFTRWAVNEGLVYRIYVPLKPADQDAVDRRILRWRLRGLFSPALKREPFDRVLRDNYIQGYFGRGAWRHSRRERPLAMRLFERARRLGSPEAALNSGLVYFEEGRIEEAERCWREARDGAPGRPEAWVNLALVALRKLPPQADEAIRLCETALARNPKFTRAHEILASAWYVKGDLPQAVSRLKEAIALEPGNARLRKMLDAMVRGVRRGPPR